MGWGSYTAGTAQVELPLTPTRFASRHSRCSASAFLVLRTAAKGRLCLPLSGGGILRPQLTSGDAEPSMASSIQIRPAFPGECRRIAEIHVLARYEMAYLPHVHSFTSVEKWIREIVLPSQEALVAETDGAAVAYAWLHGGFLRALYVHPSYQRRGIGSGLLAEIRKTAPGGFSLWVFEANEGAIRFYERHGATSVRKDRRQRQPGEAAGPADVLRLAASAGTLQRRDRVVQIVCADVVDAVFVRSRGKLRPPRDGRSPHQDETSAQFLRFRAGSRRS